MNESSLQAAVRLARARQDDHLAQFKELVRIPSVSTDPAYKSHVLAAADWLVAHMQSIGLEHCAALPTAGYPVVYGDWLHAGADRPTILVYAHYDVQPADPFELWDTPPFEPTVRDGRLYARGAFDDKSGVFINLKAIEAMMSAGGGLPVNVKLFFEGEEETGSPSISPFIREHAGRLSADVLLICDGGMQPKSPRIMTAVRGLVAGEVIITGPAHDLHSGMYGGGIHNPAHMAGKIIAALHDEAGRVQIPGFYEGVRVLSPEARADLLLLDEQTQAEHLAQSGAPALWGVPEYSYIERVTAQPTCEINGITSGYQGEGGKTIIPSRASFKVTMRLVPDQVPHDIAEKFRRFVAGFACETLDIQAVIRGEAPPSEVLTDGPVIEALSDAFEAVWGKRPILERSGGSIPIISEFSRELQIPLAIPGYGCGGGVHSPNEYLLLEAFFGNIETAIRAFHNLAAA